MLATPEKDALNRGLEMDTCPANIPGQNGKKEYDKREIERLYFQIDNLFHSRFQAMFVAESIFFIAAATAWKSLAAVAVLSTLGICVTILFFFPNLRLHWRLCWLIEKMKRSHFFSDYLSLSGFKTENLGRVGKWLFEKMLRDPNKTETSWRRFLSPGWIYIWGLPTILIGGWASLFVVRVCVELYSWGFRIIIVGGWLMLFITNACV